MIVAVRVALLILGLSAVLYAVRAAYDGAHSRKSDDVTYVCPMHPEVKEGAPGECPLCRMALVEASEAASDGRPPSGELVTIDVGDLRVVERRTLSQPKEVIAPAWVDGPDAVVALVHDDDLCALGEPGARASFVASGGRARVDVRLADAAPTRRDVSRSMVRFSSDGAQFSPSFGDVGTIVALRKPCEWLVVPSSAILESVDGPYVLTVSRSGGADPVYAKDLTRRPVHVGGQFSKFTVVLDGLRDEETVVAKSAYSVDAELGPHRPF